MSEALSTIKYNIELYYGDFVFLVITIVAFIYLAITCKELRGKILVPIGLIVFCVVNPILYKYVFSGIIYWRLFWTIPDAMIIALAITKLIEDRKNIVLKIGILITSVGMIVLLGKNTYKESVYSKAQNWYKLNNEVIEVCDIMFSYTENVRCVAPETLFCEIRQYKEDIIQMYGRDIRNGMIVEHKPEDDWFIYIKIERMEPNIEGVFDYAYTKGYNFIIIYSDMYVQMEAVHQFGYEVIAITDKHKIFYNESLENER